MNDDFSELDEFARIFETINNAQDPFGVVRGFMNVASSRLVYYTFQ